MFFSYIKMKKEKCFTWWMRLKEMLLIKQEKLIMEMFVIKGGKH